MEAQALNKFFVFSQKKTIFIFWEMKTPNKFFKFLKTEILKKLLLLQEVTFGVLTTFLIFQEMELPSPKLKSLLIFQKDFLNPGKK